MHYLHSLMKQIKLSTQMGWGYGALVFITLMLGVMAVWNMKSVQSEAEVLAEQRFPLLTLANDLQAEIQKTMHAVRTFNYGHQKESLLASRQGLANIGNLLQKIKQSGRSEDAAFVFKTDEMRAYAEQLNGLLLEDIETVKQLDSNKQSLIVTVDQFLKICKQNLKEEPNTPPVAGEKLLAIQHILMQACAISNDLMVAIDLKQWDRLDNVQRKINEMVALSSKLAENVSYGHPLAQLHESAAYFSTVTLSFINMLRSFQKISDQQNEIGNMLGSAISALSDQGLQEAHSIAASAASRLYRFSNIMMVGLFLSVLLGIGTAIWITSTITTGIRKVIHGLSDSSQEVSSASNEVSLTSQELSEGTSRQAASIEQTSSSLEEMSSMTRQNAASALSADRLMQATSSVVESANASMIDLTQSMQEIAQSSQETHKIIKTIDEIAFQTNLLALNAAVEAARAGEAGAGFAVVADEVRSLAMRAAQAAKSTADLIDQSVQKIKRGSTIVNETNTSFGQVEKSAKEAAHLVDAISTASQEQSRGIEQINGAIAEMDRVIQDNAASAEASASASEQLNAQAEQLQNYVSQLLLIVDGQDTSNRVLLPNDFPKKMALPKRFFQKAGEKFFKRPADFKPSNKQ